MYVNIEQIEFANINAGKCKLPKTKRQIAKIMPSMILKMLLMSADQDDCIEIDFPGFARFMMGLNPEYLRAVLEQAVKDGRIAMEVEGDNATIKLLKVDDLFE